MLLDCIVTNVISARIKKKSKLVNFCVSTLMLKMEGKKQHFWHIMLYCLKKSENATETKKGLLQCVEIVKNGF